MMTTAVIIIIAFTLLWAAFAGYQLRSLQPVAGVSIPISGLTGAVLYDYGWDTSDTIITAAVIALGVAGYGMYIKYSPAWPILLWPGALLTALLGGLFLP